MRRDSDYQASEHSSTPPLPRFGPPVATEAASDEETATRREAGAELHESGPVAAVAVEAPPAPSSPAADAGSYRASITSVVKNSGIYAIAAMGAPLVSLIMMPYIAQHVSRSDYGLLTLLNTTVTLTAGITALGLGSAFFRTYNYEAKDDATRRSALATVTLLLLTFTTPIAVLAMIFSTQIATLFLGNAADGRYVALAAGVVIVQNLTIPGLSWMRAESRAPYYVALAFTNLLVTLGATVLLVGPLNMGVAGALIGNGAGYLALDVVALPFVLAHGGLRIRPDVMWRLVSFGAPQVLSLISYWFLQVSDRYLLAGYTSLAEVARYAVAYTLGSVLGTILVNPFQLAWPTLLYSIAKRENPGPTYARIFAYYSLVLIFGAFGLALVGPFALTLLFPAGYTNAAPVIPLISLSLALYGSYMYFMLGASVRRNLWMAPVFVTIAAVVNIGMNVLVIPRYGSMGAAAATLAAYVILTGLAYVANQRIYPVPYRHGRTLFALVLGIALLAGVEVLTSILGANMRLALSGGALMLYTLVVGVLALSLRHAPATHAKQTIGKARRAPYVGMFVPGIARTDARVLREASALVKAGYALTLVDMERDTTRPRHEVIQGVPVQHIFMPSRFKATRFKPWFLVKFARQIAVTTWTLLRVRADIYHAHDMTALPAIYIAARLKRKPFIYDAHELPLSHPALTKWGPLYRVAVAVFRAILKRAQAIITVSPPIADELQRRFGGPYPVLVRNTPIYKPWTASNRIREHLGLPETTRIALYQGYLLADRWLDGLVQSTPYMAPDHVIVLIGEGAMQPRIETLVKQLGLEERVRLIPYVPYAELLSWTSSADLGLCVFDRAYSPSIEMCLPNKLFEYLMAGLPVLASPLPAVADILERYEVGRVAPTLDHQVVGEAISALLADDMARKQMSRNALTAAAHDLCWEAEQHRLVDLYGQLLGAKGLVAAPSPQASASLATP